MKKYPYISIIYITINIHKYKDVQNMKKIKYYLLIKY